MTNILDMLKTHLDRKKADVERAKRSYRMSADVALRAAKWNHASDQTIQLRNLPTPNDPVYSRLLRMTESSYEGVDLWNAMNERRMTEEVYKLVAAGRIEEAHEKLPEDLKDYARTMKAFRV